MNPLKNLLFKDSQFKTPADCSTGGDFDCVSVAISPEGVGVRSTLDETKTTINFSHEEWRNFIKAVKGGGFEV